VVLLAVGQFVLSGSTPVELRSSDLPKEPMLRKRSPTLDDRQHCRNQIVTSERLSELRQQMNRFGVQAYIIPSDNAHQSEMVSARDHRREFISGFSGSAGTAVVTQQEAALWTDGRYFDQADLQLDCNWIAMKEGKAEVPKITEWLREVLTGDDRVAADPTLIGAETWNKWQKELGSVPFDALPTNLIDEIWNESNGRPPSNKQPAFILPLKYSGMRWQDKLDTLMDELVKLDVDSMVVTALDEVAWLLNIRGSDVPNEPMLMSYLFVSSRDTVLFADPDQIPPQLHTHLNSFNCARAKCVTIRPYDQFIDELKKLTELSSRVLVPRKYSYTGGSSFAVYQAIAAPKRVMKTSPVLMMKAKKNTIEVAGMKNAHLKDAVAVCDCFSQIDEEVPNGIYWDELKISQSLLDYRAQQKDNRGASFETIGGFGANGAIIHYTTSIDTNVVIDNSSLLLVDSGGQYLDGTTDVSRTLHFGNATDEEKVSYTRVLMGHVDLARTVIPQSVKDTRIDILARNPLFLNGLDYLHGTGHGIGSFLSVHESPTYIGIGGTEENKFEENYFFTDEPGYYKSGHYGIRIESVFQVVPAVFQTQLLNRFYRFQPVTLVPFELKLILPELLNSEQIRWINDYNTRVRHEVGNELLRQNRSRAYNWLIDRTHCIAKPC